MSSLLLHSLSPSRCGAAAQTYSPASCASSAARTRELPRKRLPLLHQPLLEATSLHFISFRGFVSANNEQNWILGMVKYSECYKPCAGCNSTPKGSFKDTKTVERRNFSIVSSIFFFFSSPSFESLNLTKEARPVPKQIGSLEGDQKSLGGRGSPEDLTNSCPWPMHARDHNTHPAPTPPSKKHPPGDCREWAFQRASSTLNYLGTLKLGSNPTPQNLRLPPDCTRLTNPQGRDQGT